MKEMKIVIYSKEDCPYCDSARELLKSLGKEFIEYKLDRDFSRPVLKELFPTAKTYPVITINGVYIGGCDDLHEFMRNK